MSNKEFLDYLEVTRGFRVYDRISYTIMCNARLDIKRLFSKLENIYKNITLNMWIVEQLSLYKSTDNIVDNFINYLSTLYNKFEFSEFKWKEEIRLTINAAWNTSIKENEVIQKLNEMQYRLDKANRFIKINGEECAIIGNKVYRLKEMAV